MKRTQKRRLVAAVSRVLAVVTKSAPKIVVGKLNHLGAVMQISLVPVGPTTEQTKAWEWDSRRDCSKVTVPCPCFRVGIMRFHVTNRCI